MKNKKLSFLIFFTVVLMGVLFQFVPFFEKMHWILKLAIILVVSLISGMIADKYMSN
jgi:hypothetical protein